MIADLRFINTFTPKPLPTFHLPSITDIASTMASFPNDSLWASTLDLSNFFWSLVLPPEFQDTFHIEGAVYQSLPFGWNLSPIIAQTTLTEFVFSALVSHGFLPFLSSSLFFFVYLHDVIFIASSHTLCKQCTLLVVHDLRDASFVISPKSCLTPSKQVKWIGKVFDFTYGSICIPRPPFLAHWPCHYWGVSYQ